MKLKEIIQEVRSQIYTLVSPGLMLILTFILIIGLVLFVAAAMATGEMFYLKRVAACFILLILLVLIYEWAREEQ